MSVLLAVLLSAAPSPGSYIHTGGWGTLVLEKGRFRIDTVGGNAHVCSISGTWSGAKGLANDDGETCELTFEAKGDGVEVSSQDTEMCRSYCGVRATFDGTFLKPAKGCAPKEVAKTRASFKALYDKKDFANAVATLKPVLACEPVIDLFEVAWIRNDLAIAQHKAGDDAACLVTLEPLADYRDSPPGELWGGEPSYEELRQKLAKATRTNAKLCGFKGPADAGK